MKIANKLKGSDVKYIVIDAGWFESESAQGGVGDWEIKKEAFPYGTDLVVRVAEVKYKA